MDKAQYAQHRADEHGLDEHTQVVSLRWLDNSVVYVVLMAPYVVGPITYNGYSRS